MKLKLLSFLSALVMLALVPVKTAVTNSPQEKILFGGTYTLEPGQTLYDNLLAIGGTVKISQDATVNGNIRMLGGSLTISGTIYGDIKTTAASLVITDSAVIQGDLLVNGGTLIQSSDALITGNLTRNLAPFSFNFPHQLLPLSLPIFHPVQNVLWFVFQCLALTAVTMLIALVFPHSIIRVANATSEEPAIAGAIGILTILIYPIAFILLCLTLILIPLAGLAVVALAFAWILGWIGFGAQLGIRFTHLIKREWHIALSAGLGTLVLTVVMRAVASIPCIGWIFPFLVGMIGLGAAVMTGFGSQYGKPDQPAKSFNEPAIFPPQ